MLHRGEVYKKNPYNTNHNMEHTMNIELNIGLDVPSATNTPASRDMLAVRATAYLTGAFAGVAVRRYQSSYQQDGVTVTEAGIAVRLTADRSVEWMIASLAAMLEQDCIGVLDADTGAGVLVGPKAADWGDFNPAFFNRF